MKSLPARVFLTIVGFVVAIVITRHAMPNFSINGDRVGSVTRGDRVEQIEQRWRNQYETYYGSADATSLTANEINETLDRLTTETGERLALIYAFPQPTYLELVLVIPGQEPIRQQRQEAPLEAVKSTINTFKSYVSRPADTGQYLTSGKQLYEWIVAPLEADLQAQEIDTLIFCVGENLRSAPLAALHDGEQFLVEKYNIGRIPAFNLTNTAYSKLQNSRLLAMGASEFQSLPDLPAVPLELSTIAQNRWQSKTFLNQVFTFDNLKTQLASEQYSIVHLATHAKFQPGAPRNSYIQLWQTDRLRLDQLQQLDWSRLPVEILVLSACQTAVGDREAELGFAGLSYYAGVKSSLASLWQVSDVGTLALMREFYWQLANPDVLTKADALRRTQVAMLSGQVYVENGQLHNSGGVITLPSELKQSGRFNFSSPYHWAAFTLVGSPW